MKRGLTDIIDVKRGTTQISKIMRGAVLIWEKVVESASLPLIFTIDTNLGTGASMEIPTIDSGYDYSVKWGDGATTSGHTANASHTYATHGTYTLEITGLFPRFNFKDSLKITAIAQWGDINYSTIQDWSFFQAVNLNSLADDVGSIDNMTTAYRMFYRSNLTTLPSTMTLNSLNIGSYMFYQTPLSSIPSGMTLNSLTNGADMFFQTQVSSLPSGMTLANLIIGTNMFISSNLNSLPSGMLLSNLTNGSGMFKYTNLTSIPSGMTLDALENGSSMFYGLVLTSLPSGMTLNNLSSGNRMFYGAGFTSLPSGITLPNLTDGTYMFLAVTLNTTRYSQLLIDMESGNVNDNVIFHGGNSKYNAAGETARNALVARGWAITDGGLEV